MVGHIWLPKLPKYRFPVPDPPTSTGKARPIDLANLPGVPAYWTSRKGTKGSTLPPCSVPWPNSGVSTRRNPTDISDITALDQEAVTHRITTSPIMRPWFALPPPLPHTPGKKTKLAYRGTCRIFFMQPLTLAAVLVLRCTYTVCAQFACISTHELLMSIQ